ncbi:MAG: PEGA domain-containing protein, partial [bacterium]
PQGATVDIDNKTVGTTPLEEKIIQGTHKISIGLTGYTSTVKETNIEHDKVTSLNVTLSYIPGGLLVIVPGGWGKVLLDGQQAGYTGSPIGNLRPGRHKIEVYKGNTLFYAGVVQIVPNKVIDMRLK